MEGLERFTGVSAGDARTPALVATWALRHALRAAPPGRDREELVRWARRDPSLAPLRSKYAPQFRNLLSVYSVPDVPMVAPSRTRKQRAEPAEKRKSD